jgi:hypothetical protein
MDQERIARDQDVRPWYGNAYRQFAEFEKKVVHRCAVAVIQNGEARQGRALMAIKSGRNPPNATTPIAELRLLFVGVFDEPIGWICNYRVQGMGFTLSHPIKAAAMNQSSPANFERSHGRRR